MCGIHFALCSSGPVRPDKAMVKLLQSRGPDSFQQQEAIASARGDDHSSGKARPFHLRFSSSVLSLRGDHTAVQPFLDVETGSILCWNGEAWRIGNREVSGNDGELLFHLLVHEAPCTSPDQLSPDEVKVRTQHIITTLDSIRGPYGFVYYDAKIGKVFFGRDCLGRRSLMSTTDPNGILSISSVCTGPDRHVCDEVKANGIYVMDLWETTALSHTLTGSCKPRDPLTEFQVPVTSCIPYNSMRSLDPDATSLNTKLPAFNRSQPSASIPLLNLWSSSVMKLERSLSESMRLRVQNIPHRSTQAIDRSLTGHCKIAILFSGGLDCTILARLAHDLLPLDETIDLLNVAFENPRVIAAAKHRPTHGFPDTEGSDPYSSCPDRITGKSSHAELQRVCPARTWRFVSIDITYSETLQHRSQIISLMHPHNTEMDLSISCALYFAARGRGTVYNPGTDITHSYTSPARVLLSGLGADELFGGYTRHATAFSRHGFAGLIDELELDINRLGQRNLGRDDRVISHWGKEARYPYLDEDLLSWALTCPIWEKCGFGQDSISTGSDTEPGLEPGKKVLRLLACKMDMKGVATEKKRAIQFGARTAKMQGGNVKGTQLLS